MKEITNLHNINKTELQRHLNKLLSFHDYALEVIRKYIDEFQHNEKFINKGAMLKEFKQEVIKGKKHFEKLGVEGLARDIESFPYECVQDTLPTTVSLGGDTKFWDLYDRIQDIAFEEIDKNITPTIKTIWAGDVKKAIDAIRNFYYHEAVKSQLSEELLEEFQNSLKHYIQLWDEAIQKIDIAINACESEEDKRMIPQLKHARQNLALRKRVPEEGGINKLIASLRERPISDPRRGTLDIFRGMDDVIGNWHYSKKGDLGAEIMDAVREICAYYRSGFGFKEHKAFSYDRFRAKSEELEAYRKAHPLSPEESFSRTVEEYLARSKNWHA